LKASPASKKQRPHRQNEFSEHQNASNADALTGAGGFCKKLLSLAFLFVGSMTASFASASDVTLQPLSSVTGSGLPDPVTVVPFPVAGDSYSSATNGNGTIPSSGQTAYQSTAGDSVTSAVFALPTNSVTDLTANWTFKDFLGDGNTEDWYVYVNGTAVAQALLPDDSRNGDILSVTGTVNFNDIAPVGGGYQVELILQNTVPSGGGSVAWEDGGTTGLSYTTTPEPSSLLLMGSGILALAGALRRKLFS
jgi:hypothetical protein